MTSNQVLGTFSFLVHASAQQDRAAIVMHEEIPTTFQVPMKMQSSEGPFVIHVRLACIAFLI